MNLNTLNTYDGDNIWQDVILGIDGFDAERTEAIDPSYSSDRFVAAGTVYRYIAQNSEWVAVTGASDV